MKNHHRTRGSITTLGAAAVLVLLLSSASAAVAQTSATALVDAPMPIGGSATDPAAIQLPSGEIVTKPVDGGTSMGAPTRAAENNRLDDAPPAQFGMSRSPQLQQMAAPVTSKPAGTEQMPGGVDVANWQGNVNWQNVWNQGARFAYVKASEGPWPMNEYFAQQYNGSAGVGMTRGAYHFARPNLSSGASQAQTFVRNGGGWSADGKTLPGVLDLESNNSDQSGACFGMSAAQLTAWTADFLNTYKALTSRDAVIYTGYYFWRDCVGNSSAFSQSNPLWVPSYGISLGKVLIPGSWQRFSFWQFSDSGPYNGGDSNVFNGDASGLAKLAAGTFPADRAVLAKPATSPTIYYVISGTKYPIPDWSTYLLLSGIAGAYQDVSQAQLDQVQMGPSATPFVRSPEGAIFLLDSTKKFHVASCAQMQDFGGGPCQNWVPGAVAQLDQSPYGGILSNQISISSGASYLISNGVKREIYDQASAAAVGISSAVSAVSAAFASAFPYGQPIIRNDVRVDARFSSDAFLFSNSKRTLVTADFAGQSSWFNALSTRKMDNSSLALLTGQPAFTGIARIPSGQVAIFSGASKTLSSSNAWPSDLPVISASMSDTAPTTGNTGSTAFTKTSGDPAVYALVAGAKRPVPDWPTLQELAGSTTPAIANAESATLGSLASGPMLLRPGTMVVSPTSPQVYFVADDSNAIPVESFEISSQLNVSELLRVSANSLAPYALNGAPLNPVVSCNNTLYLGMRGGAFQRLARTANTNTLPATVLTPGRCTAFMARATIQNSIEKVFVKDPYTPTVYWLNNGVKEAVSDWATLISLNGGKGNPTIAVYSSAALKSVPAKK